MKVLVAIVTFRRPQGLEEALTALQGACASAAKAGHEVRQVVVDNDPRGSAAGTVACFESVEYVLEPKPGIPAARNTAVEQVLSGEALVFLDDDEIPEPDWLAALIDHATATAADAVFGPVIPAFPAGAPRWVVEGGFFERPRQPTGTSPRHPATNNVLISSAGLARARGAYFDLAFSETGGSDTDFFRRLEQNGATFSWVDEAVVHESIPRQRANLKWLWRRNIRLGNMTRRIKYRDRSAWQVLGLGLARVLVGIVWAPVDGIPRRRLNARSATHIPKGLGMVISAVGNDYNEYRRADSVGE